MIYAYGTPLKSIKAQGEDVNNRSGESRNNLKAGALVRGLLLVLTAMAGIGMASAQDDTVAAKFRGAIGVIPVTGVAATGAVNLNVVRGINPAGPWRISDLDGEIGFDSSVNIKGRRLLLAAGNGIGTNAGASVFATLFCGPAASATAHSSGPVALDPDGDFRISGFLSPALTGTCDSPVLLIRNAAGSGVWFAAGIPDSH